MATFLCASCDQSIEVAPNYRYGQEVHCEGEVKGGGRNHLPYYFVPFRDQVALWATTKALEEHRVRNGSCSCGALALNDARLRRRHHAVAITRALTHAELLRDR